MIRIQIYNSAPEVLCFSVVHPDLVKITEYEKRTYIQLCDIHSDKIFRVYDPETGFLAMDYGSGLRELLGCFTVIPDECHI